MRWITDHFLVLLLAAAFATVGTWAIRRRRRNRRSTGGGGAPGSASDRRDTARPHDDGPYMT